MTSIFLKSHCAAAYSKDPITGHLITRQSGNKTVAIQTALGNKMFLDIYSKVKKDIQITQYLASFHLNTGVVW